MLNNGKKYPFKWLLWTKEIEIKKSGSTCQISGQSNNPSGRKTVTDRNTERQKHRKTDRLEFYKDR